jgi:hypothetical protein
MAVSYENAMKQLQSMFTDFDRETIKSVLISNKGYLEKTIEDLLQMATEKEEPGNVDDDNLFSQGIPNKPQNKPPPKQNNRDIGLFEDPDLALGVPSGGNAGLYFEDDEDKTKRMARELQEKEDMKLAYQLQQEYLKQMQAEGGEGEEYEEGEEGEEEDDPNPGNNSGPGRAYRAEEQKSNGNNGPSGQPEKKKKKGFGSKIKSAFASLFKKKKKGGAVKGPGEYAEVGDDDPTTKSKMSSTGSNFNQSSNKPSNSYPSLDRPSSAQTSYNPNLYNPSSSSSSSYNNQGSYQSSYNKPNSNYNQPMGQSNSVPKKNPETFNQPQQKVQPPKEDSDDEGDIKQLQFDQLDDDEDQQKNDKPIQLSDILNGGNDDDEDDDPTAFTNNKTKKNFMADGESSPIGYDHFNYRK